MLENDQVIWKMFIEGNKSSFQQLIHINYKSLLNYGTKFSEDIELVKDCIQDLFLNLWEKRNTLSSEVNTKAYLFSSLRRLLHRKIASLSQNKISRAIYQSKDLFNFQISIEQQFITAESSISLSKKIASALERLPPRQKEIVYLKFFHNFSRDEIAQAMTIAPQTVSNLLQIALKKLRSGFDYHIDLKELLLILPLIIKEINF